MPTFYTNTASFENLIVSGGVAGSTLLSVSGSQGGVFNLTDGSRLLGLQSGSDMLFTVTSTKRIGINTSNPAYNLEVSGTVAFSNLAASPTPVPNLVMANSVGQLFMTASSAYQQSAILTGSMAASVNVGATNVFQIVSASNTIIRVDGDTTPRMGFGSSTIPSASIQVYSGSIGLANPATTGYGALRFYSPIYYSFGGNNYYASIESSGEGIGQDIANLTFSTVYGTSHPLAERMRITGQGAVIMSGSLTVSQSLNALGGVTGSLQGTASWARNALTASFLPVGTYSITSSWAVSASQAVTASYITGSAFASNNPALSASYALTASHALNAASPFPFTGDAQITGSLIITGSSSNVVTIRQNSPGITLDENTQVSSVGSGSLLFRDRNFIAKAANSTIARIGVMDSTDTAAASILFTKATSTGTNRANINFIYSANNTDSGIYISGSGQVGIGTTTPSASLDVAGAARYRSGLTVTGSLIAPNITGSLRGTASWAASASVAVTSTRPLATSGSTIYSTLPSAGLGFSVDNSIIIGSQAGESAANASNSTFIGNSAGFEGINANDSNFIGSNAGTSATNASYSNFIGSGAGTNATNANDSNFIGAGAGSDATYADGSTFIGTSAGANATNAYSSNFIGTSAGSSAIFANDSNFIGSNAGTSATNANDSNFLGDNAGRQATNANRSNFIGTSAGFQATNANKSNFLGWNAGLSATNAAFSNFIGTSAGRNATSADNSNFLGLNAGWSAISASFSTLIGYQVGYVTSSGVASIGPNNIIIGTNITLPNGTRNAINLGGIIFATGSYSTTTGNPFSGSVSGARVGIGTSSPSASLHVSGANIIVGLTGTEQTIGMGGSLSDESFGTAFGYKVLVNNQYPGGVVLPGSANIGIGFGALTSNTTGFYNIAIGVYAMSGSTQASRNSAIGYQSLNVLSSGSEYNTAMGWRTGLLLRSGSFNTIVGGQSAFRIISGSSNTSLGYLALAGLLNSTASFNVAVGQSTLANATYVTNSVAVGYLAGFNGPSDSVFIGYQAGYNETGNNKLYIANTSSSFLIKGDFARNELYLTGSVQVTGSLYTSGSVVGINTTSSVHSSTVLEINGNNSKGVRLPIILSGTGLPSPAIQGLMVYAQADIDTSRSEGVFVHDGTTWHRLNWT